jgi:hypothetical protein
LGNGGFVELAKRERDRDATGIERHLDARMMAMQA